MPVFAKVFPNYVSASVALSFAGFLNGYDTGSIGSIVHMPQFADSMGFLSATTIGVTVSVIMLTGIGPALLGGYLADRYGRLRVILPGAAIFGVGALLQASAFNLAQFITGRALSGAGQGIFLANVSVYITEIAPMRRRGRLAAMPQFMAALGICIGYFACYSTASASSSMAWRLPYVVQVAVSTELAFACCVLPESPRWLLLHDRASDVMEALELLDFNLDEARRDFLIDPQAHQRPTLSDWQTFATLFERGYLARTLLGLFILSMAQLSGIDAITYYAPALFTQAGISTDRSSLVASGVASIAMLAVSIPAFLLADRWGRRTAIISGGICLSAIMLLIGSLYAAGAVYSTGVARWVVIISVFLFGIIFCATWGIVPKIYASEIQPSHTRAAGNSVGMAFSFFTNWLVALITPILLAASAYGAYFLFGGFALFGVAVFFLHMPETRGRSLESIQGEFLSPATGQPLRLLPWGGLRRRAVTAGSRTMVEQFELQSNETQGPSTTAISRAVEAGGFGLRLDASST